MSQHSMSMKLVCSVALVGLLTMVPGARTASAQNVNDMVRTLNNIVNPGDAQRLEDQARRNGHVQEERYWRDYRTGLDSPDRYRRDYGPDYRGRGDYRYPATTAIPATAAIRATIQIKEIIATIGAEPRLAMTLVSLVSSRQKQQPGLDDGGPEVTFATWGVRMEGRAKWRKR